ncbi:MAG: hypothetical protein E7327_07785 [Clostridiales bacterium]|nr:hypothetical protein [Clostridiales bacterium]
MAFRRIRWITVVLLALMLLTCGSTAVAQSGSGFLPVREYEGAVYEARPPADLTTVLLIGYDHRAEGQEEELHGYSRGGQADFLMLLVADHENQVIRTLQFDRDTITGVKVTDFKGRQLEPRNIQICLAHAYGNTREKNNANTIWSVENLMGIAARKDGAQIDWYVAMDISGISRLNDLLGGVTVTIPDDMTAFDPQMKKGATLKLTGAQAEIFCRGRRGIGNQTNASRMERQRMYMDAAGERLTAEIRKDAGFASELLTGMGVIYDAAVDSSNPFARQDAGTPTGEADGRYLMSSETVSGIVNLISRTIGYTRLPTEIIPGRHVLADDGYIHFIPDEGAPLAWSIATFYRIKD